MKLPKEKKNTAAILVIVESYFISRLPVTSSFLNQSAIVMETMNERHYVLKT